MSDHDKEFEDYLAGNTELSTLYNASKNAAQDEPSSDLDNSILAAAKREVASKPKNNKKNYSPFSTNYFIPLSTAATVFIVVAAVSFFPKQQSIDYDLELASEPMPTIATVPMLDSTVADKTKALAKRQKPSNEKLTLSKNKTEVIAPMPVLVEKSTVVSSSKESLDIVEAELATDREPKKMLTPQAQFSSALNKQRLNSTKSESKVSSIKNLSKAKKKKALVQREQVLRQRKSIDSENDYSTALAFEGASDIREEQRKDTPSDTLFLDSLMTRAVVDSDASKLKYDKQRWQHFSPKQWREAMVKIYKKQGKLKTQEIIKIYNIKFPELKLDIDAIIAAAKNE